jgi:ribosomal protein S20
MSEVRWQNIINTLQERRFKTMSRITELQTIARRCAFEAVVHDSWKAKQTFRDAEHEADRLASEVNILDLALAEAYERTQQRDWKDVMAELMGANK